jgi:hypothetical protein
MTMEQIQCSETSAYKIQTPGNYAEENIQQEEPCFNSQVYKLLTYMQFYTVYWKVVNICHVRWECVLTVTQVQNNAEYLYLFVTC